MSRWTFDQIPDQRGRVAIVTGANTGIGFETARMLAAKGARVVLACRNAEKANDATRRILDAHPGTNVEVRLLDLSDLDSVEKFASSFESDRLDLLINNAGVMVPPLSRTKQGFELQFGTNHLGHFALTGRLLPILRQTPDARVVTVSSTAQYIGRIDFDDLQWERRRYIDWFAYGQSKLANMMFALELARRAEGTTLRSLAAHPGWTPTDLQRTSLLAQTLNPILPMTPTLGALPTVRAATDPDAPSGSYWGPANVLETFGHPVRARIFGRATNRDVARRLFERSEELTGVRFNLR